MLGSLILIACKDAVTAEMSREPKQYLEPQTLISFTKSLLNATATIEIVRPIMQHFVGKYASAIDFSSIIA